ncbi:MAG TPA: hypothetical protein VM841_07725, partial [Actinomycetota bacterium]|nr:hypothetical protein [Actinomycetota bacterium]
SSKGGLTAELAAVADGGDDYHAATIACFYARQTTSGGPGLNNNWNLLSCDSTPTMPDASTSVFLGQGPGLEVRPDIIAEDTQNFRAFSVDVNTAALPGGITSAMDVFVQVCGDGNSSYGRDGAYDGPDRNLAFPIGGLPFANNCDGVGGTIGWDYVGDVRINNTRPVIRAASFPNNGYHGDALPASTSTISWQTTPDATGVSVSVCTGVDPDLGIGAGRGAESTIYGGGCIIDTVPANGGPTVWTLSFGTAGPGPDVILPLGATGRAVRVEGVVCSTFGCAGGPSATDTPAAHYNMFMRDNSHFARNVKLVWDYAAGPGDRTCQGGASAATSRTDAWAPNVTVPPAPARGVLDVYNTQAPVLKVCVTGDSGLSIPVAGVPVAYEVVSGPGDIDSDSPTYRETGWVPCTPPFSAPCSGGYRNTGAGPIFNGYSRPGNVAEPPLIDSLGRLSANVCSLGSCQRGDITNGFRTPDPLANWGVDWAAVNSLQTGTTVYRACVDLNGNLSCDAGEVSATATMEWTPSGRNHNHLWLAGTAGTDGHTGTATIAAPAGGTVNLTGIAHTEGHQGLANTPVIWRIGTNSPGHFVSTEQTTDANGTADATIGSSVLDAGRTTAVLFCGDGDSDGVCDQTPAQFEVNWGGVVTSSSITSFSVEPTIGVFGTDFVISGTLLDGGSNPVSSASVSIQRRTLGSNDWVEIRSVISNGTGAFSMTDVDLAYNSDYRAVFPGNVSYTGATSDTDRAWVRVGIAMNVSDPTVFAGQSVRISGRVLPAHPGAVVVLQVLDNGRGWKNIAAARLSSSSTYAFRVTHHSSKSLIYRVAYPTQGILNAWNVSRNTRVTWA